MALKDPLSGLLHLVGAVLAIPATVVLILLGAPSTWKNDLAEYLGRESVDVVVDFTSPEKRMEIARAILNHGACGVIGTTGFTLKEIAELDALCRKTEKGDPMAVDELRRIEKNAVSR